MELKKIFDTPVFVKCINHAEYLILVVTLFCGLFWTAGFYYVGFLLGLASLLLIIAKVCHAKVKSGELVEEDDTSMLDLTQPELYEDSDEVLVEIVSSRESEDNFEEADEVENSFEEPNVRYKFVGDGSREENNEEVQMEETESFSDSNEMSESFEEETSEI